MALLKKKSDQSINQNNEIDKNYPTSINDYEFEGRIGKGAFASVYIANCPSKNEKVAIKVIELELDNDDKDKNKNDNKDKDKNEDGKDNNNNNNNNDISWDEIQKEAAVMARMNHKNIVPCYTSFCVTTELWLVMPLLIGSCSDIMKSIKEFNNGFIEELIISTIIRDILHAVQYIHKDGRVHRDIKSANILLSSSGICQISDFGVSGAIIEGGLRKHGRDTFTGSLWWMSPEVLQRENRHSYKADIWSLGITTLELTFGKPPHSKQRPVKVMLTILQSPPPNLQTCLDEMKQSQSSQSSQSYPKYSKKFKDFLTKCLQKDPNKRASASQLINHSFIKQAKDNKYLYDKIVSKYKQQQYNNNILPYSVSKQINNNNNKNYNNNNNKNGIINNDENNNNKNISNRIESNGFDFNSEIIHSMSNSDPISSIADDQNEDNDNNDNNDNNEQQKVGRFDVKISNNNNDNNDNSNAETTTKGRFKVMSYAQNK